MAGPFVPNTEAHGYISSPTARIPDDGNVSQLFGEIQSLTISQDKPLPLSDNGGILVKTLAVTGDAMSSQTNYDIQRSQMLDRLANSDAHFKHQQKDEPDLTGEEKRKIAEVLLQQKPGIFLERFGNYLIADDISYFEQFSSDFYVEFHRKELLKRFESSKKYETTVRNRRFEAMQQLNSGGDYFGDDEMKQRDPLLYEEMIGQHLSEVEISQMVGQSEGSLSGLLLKHLQVMQNNERYTVQKDSEECQEEEEDDEEDDGDGEEEENVMDDGERDSGKGKGISDVEKAALRSEFLSTMHERFLKGEDRNFDYSAIDNNADYDAVDMLNIDAEEKYFNEEDDDELSVDDNSGLNSELGRDDRTSLNSDSSNKMTE